MKAWLAVAGTGRCVHRHSVVGVQRRGLNRFGCAAASGRPAVTPPAPPPTLDDARLAQIATLLLERPLFSPDRRPAATPSAAAAADSAVQELPRLTGVIFGPARRSAIFADDAGHPRIAAEGTRLGRFTITAIAPGQVTVSSPDGSVCCARPIPAPSPPRQWPLPSRWALARTRARPLSFVAAAGNREFRNAERVSAQTPGSTGHSLAAHSPACREGGYACPPAGETGSTETDDVRRGTACPTSAAGPARWSAWCGCWSARCGPVSSRCAPPADRPAAAAAQQLRSDPVQQRRRPAEQPHRDQ